MDEVKRHKDFRFFGVRTEAIRVTSSGHYEFPVKFFNAGVTRHGFYCPQTQDVHYATQFMAYGRSRTQKWWVIPVLDSDAAAFRVAIRDRVAAGQWGVTAGNAYFDEGVLRSIAGI